MSASVPVSSPTVSSSSAVSFTNAAPSASTAPKSASKTKTVKLVTFNIGRLSLAVHIHQVSKVINLPVVHGSGLNPVGLVQVNNRDITVLDLHRRLFRAEADLSQYTHCYLVLVQTPQGEVVGIPVLDTPLLSEVPSTLIRVLPESYRRADTLEIASHIVVIPSAETSRTVFLLDLERLNPA